VKRSSFLIAAGLARARVLERLQVIGRRTIHLFGDCCVILRCDRVFAHNYGWHHGPIDLDDTCRHCVNRALQLPG
jgi:hypothetical protein